MKPKVRFSLQKIRLNQQGYTDSGEYFGIGLPLYFYMGEDDKRIIQGHLRAYSRDSAKLQVMQKFPNLECKFYR